MHSLTTTIGLAVAIAFLIALGVYGFRLWRSALTKSHFISVEYGRLCLYDRSLQTPSANEPIQEAGGFQERVLIAENAIGQVLVEAMRLRACLAELSDLSLQAQLTALNVAFEASRDDSDLGGAYFQVADEGVRLGEEAERISTDTLPVIQQIIQSTTAANEHMFSSEGNSRDNQLMETLALVRRESKLNDENLKAIAQNHPKIASAIVPLQSGLIGVYSIADSLFDSLESLPKSA